MAVNPVAVNPGAGCQVAVNPVAVRPADDTLGGQPILEAWRDNKDNIYRPNTRHRQQWR